MKSKDEIDFLVCSSTGIPYTHEEYEGAPVFHYGARYIPAGKTFEHKVYGVSPLEGQNLVSYWNNQNPVVWRYWEDLAKNALSSRTHQ